VGDEQVVRLLEEIRDLQKLHVENYKDALKNQKEAIDLQRRAARRSKIVQTFFILIMLVFLALLWIPHTR
jgi:hypothetical protein